jgi:hypothetical protein
MSLIRKLFGGAESGASCGHFGQILAYENDDPIEAVALSANPRLTVTVFICDGCGSRRCESCWRGKIRCRQCGSWGFSKAVAKRV